MPRPSTGRPPGRPPKLTPEVMDVVVNAIAAGNYMDTAAALAGVDKVSLYRWIKKGANATRGIKRDFYKRVTEAMARAEARGVTGISIAAQKDWKAAAWLLERRYAKRWGKREEHTLKGDPKAPLATGLAIKVLPSNPVDAEGRVLRITEQPALPAGVIDVSDGRGKAAASGLVGATVEANPGSHPGRPDQEQAAAPTKEEE